MSQNTNQPVPIKLDVVAIRDLSFSIREDLFISGKSCKVNFNQLTSFNIEENLVFFDLTVRFHYPNDEEATALSLHVQNIFMVETLKQCINADDKLILPKNILIAIVGMSVSHTRALLARHTAGTAYDGSLLPIVDSKEITKVFYPKIFADELIEPVPPKKIAKPAKGKQKDVIL